MECLPSYRDDLYLMHHGIKGQKWGVRRFQNTDGSLTNKGLKRYYGSDAKHRTESDHTNLGKKAQNIEKFISDHKKEIAIGAGIVAGTYMGWRIKEDGVFNVSLNPMSTANQEKVDWSKVHEDKIIPSGTTLHTLTKDPGSLKGRDSFYASYKKSDRDRYIGRFGFTPTFNYDEHGNIKGIDFNKTLNIQRDEHGKIIGMDLGLKLDARHQLSKDVKVASEDSSVDAFKKLFNDDSDFRRYIMDPKSMGANPYADKPVMMYKGYKKANATLKRLQKTGEEPTDSDYHDLHLLFNFSAPIATGRRLSSEQLNDMGRQRAKFQRELKDRGYGAYLDLHDALHGSYKTNAPVIVFDMEALIPKGTKKVKVKNLLASGGRERLRQLAGTYAQK